MKNKTLILFNLIGIAFELTYFFSLLHDSILENLICFQGLNFCEFFGKIYGDLSQFQRNFVRSTALIMLLIQMLKSYLFMTQFVSKAIWTFTKITVGIVSGMIVVNLVNPSLTYWILSGMGLMIKKGVIGLMQLVLANF